MMPVSFSGKRDFEMETLRRSAKRLFPQLITTLHKSPATPIAFNYTGENGNTPVQIQLGNSNDTVEFVLPRDKPAPGVITYGVRQSQDMPFRIDKNCRYRAQDSQLDTVLNLRQVTKSVGKLSSLLQRITVFWAETVEKMPVTSNPPKRKPPGIVKMERLPESIRVA